MELPTRHAKASDLLNLGILDIYGFEIFRKNGFEQVGSCVKGEWCLGRGAWLECACRQKVAGLVVISKNATSQTASPPFLFCTLPHSPTHPPFSSVVLHQLRQRAAAADVHPAHDQERAGGLREGGDCVDGRAVF